MVNSSTNSGYLFFGNRLWIDFVNTQIVQRGEPIELLNHFEDLIAWLEEARVLNAAQAQRASNRLSDPAERSDVLERARSFRSELRRALEYLAQSSALPEDTLAAINEALRHRSGYTQLVEIAGRYERQYVGPITDPSHLLSSIAESAADTLVTADLSLLRKCDDPACILYFLDTTRNHTRRWCSMDMCGNRHKAAAHYERARVKSK